MLKKNITQFVIFFMFLFMVLLGTSSSYAWSYDQFIEYMEQIVISDQAPTNFKNSANKILQYKNTISNNIDKTATSYIIVNAGGTGWLDIRTLSGTINITSTNSNTINFSSKSSKQLRLDRNNGSIANGGNVSLNYVHYDSVIGLLDMPTVYEDQLPSNAWLQNKYIQGMEWHANNREIVNFNGYNNVNAINLNYNTEWLNLGYLSKLNDNHEYYTFVLTDSGGKQIGTIWWNKTETAELENSSLSFLPSYKSLYVNTRLLYKNVIYTLAIYSSSISPVITNAEDSLQFTYVFINDNATISNGEITNIGSGDGYSTQNSTNDIINFLGGTADANNTISNFLSGDSSSFANNIGYSPITNPFVGIIENTLTSIVNILLGSGNETLTIALRDEPIVLHSENFTIPDGAIKTFITLVTNGFLVWAIIKYGFELYQWINTGRLQNLVNEANGHWYKALF